MTKNNSRQSNGEAYVGFAIGFCMILYWDLFPEHFQEPTLYILLGATMLSVLCGEKKEEEEFL